MSKVKWCVKDVSCGREDGCVCERGVRKGEVCEIGGAYTTFEPRPLFTRELHQTKAQRVKNSGK